MRGGVIDAFDGRREADVGHLPTGWRLRGITKASANRKNACRRLAIAFLLDRVFLTAHHGIVSGDDAGAPCDAILANHNGYRAANRSPGIAQPSPLKALHTALDGAPVCRGDYDQLCRTA